MSRARVWLDAVSNGVLDERLQYEIWYKRFVNVSWNVDMNLESISKSRPLNVDIARHELELVAERNFLAARRVNRQS